MIKTKINTWFTLELETEIFQYFYEHIGYNRENIPRFKITILDSDSRVYTFNLTVYESYIEDEIAALYYDGDLYL